MAIQVDAAERRRGHPAGRRAAGHRHAHRRRRPGRRPDLHQRPGLPAPRRHRGRRARRRPARSRCSCPRPRSARSRSAVPCSTCCSAVTADHPDVRFLHAEVYAHPHEELDTKAPVVDELGLTFEPCLVLVGADGKVVERLDTIFDEDEVDEALARLDLRPPVTFGAVDAPAAAAPLEPGLHVARPTPTPARPRPAARRASWPADLCTTAQEADVLLDDLSTLPPLDADALIRLVARWPTGWQPPQRIVERTVDRAAETVGERLAAIGHRGGGAPDRGARPGGRGARGPRGRGRRRGAAARPRERRGRGGRTRRPPAPAAAARPPRSSGGVDRRRAAAKRRRFGLSRGRAGPSLRGGHQRVHQPPAADGGGHRRGLRCPAGRRALASDLLLLLQAQRDRADGGRAGGRARAGATWPATIRVEDVEARRAALRPAAPGRARRSRRTTVGVRAVSTLRRPGDSSGGTEAWRSLGFDAPDRRARRHGSTRMAARLARPVVLVGGAVERARADRGGGAGGARAGGGGRRAG